MVWAPSLVRRVLRHRVTWAVIALASFGGATSLLNAQLAAVNTAKAQWGATSPVVVVQAPVAAGELLAGRVAVEQVPDAVVAAGALAQVSADARAVVELYPGEMVLASRAASAGEASMAAGSVAMTVIAAGPTSLIEAGDLVDLWATDSADQSSRRVAAAVVVLDIDEPAVAVAIPAAQAESIAVASLRPLTIALVGSSPASPPPG